GAAPDHLELDRSGPNLVRAGYVEENAAVTGHAGTRRMGGFAPLELSTEMVVGVFFLGDDVAVFRAGDVEHAVMDLEDLVRIFVFALLFQEGVEALQVLAVEEADHASFLVSGRQWLQQRECA